MTRSTLTRAMLAVLTLLVVSTGVAQASSQEPPAAVDSPNPEIASAEHVSVSAAIAIASAPTQVQIRQSSFTEFTLSSPQTLDMVGVQPSLYRGKYYRKAIESRRLCIVKRESEGHYYSVNHTGSYRGAYQVSAALAEGATWMMLPEHQRLMGVALAQATMAQLRATKFNAWPRYWQDALFSTVANWKHTGYGFEASDRTPKAATGCHACPSTHREPWRHAVDACGWRLRRYCSIARAPERGDRVAFVVVSRHVPKDFRDQIAPRVAEEMRTKIFLFQQVFRDAHSIFPT